MPGSVTEDMVEMADDALAIGAYPNFSTALVQVYTSRTSQDPSNEEVGAFLAKNLASDLGPGHFMDYIDSATTALGGPWPPETEVPAAWTAFVTHYFGDLFRKLDFNKKLLKRYLKKIPELPTYERGASFQFLVTMRHSLLVYFLAGMNTPITEAQKNYYGSTQDLLCVQDVRSALLFQAFFSVMVEIGKFCLGLTDMIASSPFPDQGQDRFLVVHLMLRTESFVTLLSHEKEVLSFFLSVATKNRGPSKPKAKKCSSSLCFCTPLLHRDDKAEESLLRLYKTWSQRSKEQETRKRSAWGAINQQEGCHRSCCIPLGILVQGMCLVLLSVLQPGSKRGRNFLLQSLCSEERTFRIRQLLYLVQRRPECSSEAIKELKLHCKLFEKPEEAEEKICTCFAASWLSGLELLHPHLQDKPELLAFVVSVLEAGGLSEKDQSVLKQLSTPSHSSSSSLSDKPLPATVSQPPPTPSVLLQATVTRLLCDGCQQESPLVSKVYCTQKCELFFCRVCWDACVSGIKKDCCGKSEGKKCLGKLLHGQYKNMATGKLMKFGQGLGQGLGQAAEPVLGPEPEPQPASPSPSAVEQEPLRKSKKGTPSRLKALRNSKKTAEKKKRQAVNAKARQLRVAKPFLNSDTSLADGQQALLRSGEVDASRQAGERPPVLCNSSSQPGPVCREEVTPATAERQERQESLAKDLTLSLFLFK